ncbi:MAG: UDP-N-acetylmuramoyl-tripeptide--D-alanyl-D-alanine ligase [Candidatus Neomarinimicrobiota bacterium]|jgi:UDP-N-acetylmuramoyl-tripeptide--D-alanyl-D-alanine ligase|nr:UDP-N-acetylmuramoyl-tripeptide--D-alanyl-D-alanine ligase [Candidatus Neomarinimicrobiota bacterium]MDX9779515.1 UDP-N-acetylmuramoyl-tripeptide--D-alanyl-D-alanine ligase [bacterium]
MKTKILQQGPFELRNIEFAEFRGVSIDTRSIKKGEIFCALPGSRFDGHRFVKIALQYGAAAAMVSREYAATAAADEALIIVEDTLFGLQDLARLYIRSLKIPVFALTGSAGKTSTRRLLKHILSTSMKVAETPGNFNNRIGLPLSILGIRGDEDLVLLEMGTSHPGEIRDLCSIVTPDYGLITSIGHAHMGGFITIESVQKAKFELFESVRKGGTLFINQNDPRVRNFPDSVRHNRIRYGINCPAHFNAKLQSLDEHACHTLKIEENLIRLKTPGPGAAQNAVAAYAVCRTLGLPAAAILPQIESFRPEAGRGKMENWEGITLIDDSYNANPVSVKNALNTLKNIRCDGRKILVFADMLEMGEESRSSHSRVAEEALESGVQHLFCYGKESLFTLLRARQLNFTFAHYYEDKRVLAEDLKFLSRPDDVILFKASRGMAVEEIIQIMKGL